MAITFTPKVGDVISQPKNGLGGSIIQHKILCINDGFIHNHPNTGVAYIDEDDIDFENGEVDKFKGSNWERMNISKDAKKLLEQPYDAKYYNCEHFVNEVRNKKIVSPQANFFDGTANVALVGGAGLLLAGGKIKSSKAKWAVIILLLIAGIIKFFLHTTKSPA